MFEMSSKNYYYLSLMNLAFIIINVKSIRIYYAIIKKVIGAMIH